MHALETATHRREALHDWALAVGLTLFGWAQLALIPAFVVGRGPGGPAFPVGPAPGDAMTRVPFFFALEVAAPTVLAYVLVALASLPLGWRRRFPIPVLAVSLLFTSVYELTRHPPVLVSLAPLIALFTAGTLLERKALVRVALASIVFALAASLPGQPTARLLPEAVRVTAMFAFAAALGDATRNRRAYVAEVEQRAVEAERSRDEEARRRVEEERLRIARELHDVTAHSLSIIAVQAGAAQKVIEHDPEAAKRALETIRTTSKSSLDELRAILGVLRGREDGVPLAPTGSVARLSELARTVESAGVKVELHTVGVGALPAYADVSAYRIVQEALTNVVRHSRATRASVELSSDGDVLTIEVTDNGAAGEPPADSVEGHGIAGMRERIAALGGEFSAGPVSSGGFKVRARVPLAGGAP